MTTYTVTVGNLGVVYEGFDHREASATYFDYAWQADSGYGRVAFEPVTIMVGDEVLLEYTPPPELDPELERTLVDAVKRHAIEHYNESGWDFIVECYEDREIALELRRRQLLTVDTAIADFAETAKVKAEARREAQSETF